MEDQAWDAANDSTREKIPACPTGKIDLRLEISQSGSNREQSFRCASAWKIFYPHTCTNRERIIACIRKRAEGKQKQLVPGLGKHA
jgi:hypothetical protein